MYVIIEGRVGKWQRADMDKSESRCDHQNSVLGGRAEKWWRAGIVS